MLVNGHTEGTVCLGRSSETVRRSMQAAGSMGRSNVGDVYPVIRCGGSTVEGNRATAGSEMDEGIGKP